MQKSCSCETQIFGLEETLGAPLVHLSTQGREDFLLRFQSMPGWPHVTQLSQSQQPHQQVLLSETFSWPHSCLLHHAGIQSLNPVHSGQVVILQRWAMKASWVPFCCLEPPLVPSIMLLHSGKPVADAAFQSWICQPSELGAKYTVFIISHLVWTVVTAALSRLRHSPFALRLPLYLSLLFSSSHSSWFLVPPQSKTIVSGGKVFSHLSHAQSQLMSG